MIRYYISLLFIFLSCFSLVGQQALSLKQAIQIGINENPATKIAINNAQIAAEQNNAGFAGMLPQLGLTGGYGYSLNSTHQKYSSGAEVNKTGASTNTLSGGLTLNQTIYDGGKMFATRNRLSFMASSALATKDLIAQQLAEQIVDAYYDISRQTNLLRELRGNEYYYNERYNTAKVRREVGKASDQELLQAEIDRNANAAAVYRQKANLDNAYITLNRLLNRSPVYPFSITDTLVPDIPFIFDTLTTSIVNRNPQLLSNQMDIKSANSVIREQRSNLFPHIYGSVFYNYAYTHNAVGFILLNQINGPGVGLTLSYNLFTGRVNQRQVDVAKLQLDNASQVFKGNLITVQADARQALNQYEAMRQVAALLGENTAKAKQNINLALERYKLANITQVDLIQAQLSYETASLNYIQSLYDLTIAGNHLLRVTGLLKW